jgi:hypothetical protein
MPQCPRQKARSSSALALSGKRLVIAQAVSMRSPRPRCQTLPLQPQDLTQTRPTQEVSVKTGTRAQGAHLHPVSMRVGVAGGCDLYPGGRRVGKEIGDALLQVTLVSLDA